MIRVNLLPYREEARKARKQQFLVLCGISAALACLVVFAVQSVTSGQIAAQEETNAFLKTEIKKLDKEIEHIAGLKSQVDALKSRKQVIESLQIDRGETVYLLSELVTLVPEGVFLKTLKQDGTKVALTGIAQSNARVSSLMTNIDSSRWMEQPQLIETRSTSVDKRRVHEFSMTLMLTRNKGQGNPQASSAAKK